MGSRRLPRWLEHPLTRGLDVDDPRTTRYRREIIGRKLLLKQVYQDWYRRLNESLPEGQGAILELGSGAGFLRDWIPRVVCSEVFYCSWVDAVLDAGDLPFAASSLRAVVMTNVLHHVPQPFRFFEEAARCLRPGGVVTMIEPWVSRWSRFVYSRLHSEPFDLDTPGAEIASTGPLSGANNALPWIVFARDRARFESEMRRLRLVSIRPIMPLVYLASGGVSMRSLAPGWSYPLWRLLESLVAPWNRELAMFAHIQLERVD
jgi:SAM-dependent methyltransferase